jgi:hypothetical protein
MNYLQERIKQLEVKLAGLEKVNTELMRRCIYAESKISSDNRFSNKLDHNNDALLRNFSS